tara:strand:+ start:264 stop:389 length:126 start_codon:yes stop_codon:yes gene_type:complete
MPGKDDEYLSVIEFRCIATLEYTLQTAQKRKETLKYKKLPF